MSEEEYLLDAFWVISQVEANGSYEEWKKEQALGIKVWLEYFHRTYYEVEFIKKGNPDVDYCYEELEAARMAELESYADDPDPKLTTE